MRQAPMNLRLRVDDFMGVTKAKFVAASIDHDSDPLLPA
jgi:hypothetical protein